MQIIRGQGKRILCSMLRMTSTGAVGNRTEVGGRMIDAKNGAQQSVDVTKVPNDPIAKAGDG